MITNYSYKLGVVGYIVNKPLPHHASRVEPFSQAYSLKAQQLESDGSSPEIVRLGFGGPVGWGDHRDTGEDVSWQVIHWGGELTLASSRSERLQCTDGRVGLPHSWMGKCGVDYPQCHCWVTI